ncbi:hypothetical protein SAMN03080614_10671 [Anaerobranca gottschalkii DSM 13577]|uniref:Uncharacterized protein n=1 Tax=Anaerobranca gottschalkii DSM 13577 TaxID=1120990 RepID=A0A1I0CBU0_9FIRM|nr:hypothetical protein SAMN03080614_10671 [Anaerobranca gottschalkii DSM 13577]
MIQANGVNLYENPELVNCSDVFSFEPQGITISVAGSINIVAD